MKRLKSEEDRLGEDRTDQRLKMSPAHTQGLGDSSNFSQVFDRNSQKDSEKVGLAKIRLDLGSAGSITPS